MRQPDSTVPFKSTELFLIPMSFVFLIKDKKYFSVSIPKKRIELQFEKQFPELVENRRYC